MYGARHVKAMQLIILIIFLFLLFAAFPGSGPSVVEALESTELHLAMETCASIGPGPGFFV